MPRSEGAPRNIEVTTGGPHASNRSRACPPTWSASAPSARSRHPTIGTCSTRPFDAAVAEHAGIDLVFVMGDDFDHYSLGAMLEDAKLVSCRTRRGVARRSSRTTTVLAGIATAFGGLVPGEFRVFPLAQQDAAIAWVAEDAVDGRLLLTAASPADPPMRAGRGPHRSSCSRDQASAQSAPNTSGTAGTVSSAAAGHRVGGDRPEGRCHDRHPGADVGDGQHLRDHDDADRRGDPGEQAAPEGRRPCGGHRDQRREHHEHGRRASSPNPAASVTP